MPIEPDPGFELGAAHSSELNVFFPNFSNTAAISGPDLSQESEAMGDQIMASWVNFVHSGNPATEALPAWKPYAEGAVAIRFEPGQVRPYDAWSDHNCSFWRALYPDHFAR